MAGIDWMALVFFVASVEMAALYGLTISGHFPAEFRPDKLRHGWGAVIFWGTAIMTLAAAVAALLLAAGALIWPAVVIGGGAAVLFAPLLLRPLPDSFVDGRRGLLVFTLAAVLCSALLWWWTG